VTPELARVSMAFGQEVLAVRRITPRHNTPIGPTVDIFGTVRPRSFVVYTAAGRTWHFTVLDVRAGVLARRLGVSVAPRALLRVLHEAAEAAETTASKGTPA
jgi:hypothetical protein